MPIIEARVMPTRSERQLQRDLGGSRVGWIMEQIQGDDDGKD